MYFEHDNSNDDDDNGNNYDNGGNEYVAMSRNAYMKLDELKSPHFGFK